MKEKNIHPLLKPLRFYQGAVLLYGILPIISLLGLLFGFFNEESLSFTFFTFRTFFLKKDYLLTFLPFAFFFLYSLFAIYRALEAKPLWLIPIDLFLILDFLLSFFPGNTPFQGLEMLTYLLVHSTFLLLLVTRVILYVRLRLLEKRKRRK